MISLLSWVPCWWPPLPNFTSPSSPSSLAVAGLGAPLSNSVLKRRYNYKSPEWMNEWMNEWLFITTRPICLGQNKILAKGRGGGSKLVQNSVTYFMDSPWPKAFLSVGLLNSEYRTYQWDGDNVTKVYNWREFFWWIFAQIDPLIADDDKLKSSRVPFRADDAGIVRSYPLVSVDVQRSLQKCLQAKVSLSHLLCSHPFQLYPLVNRAETAKLPKSTEKSKKSLNARFHSAQERPYKIVRDAPLFSVSGYL